MDSEKKTFTHTGYHWRNELVNKLLPYVKDGVERGFPNKREFLNNRVRGYVPTFFPTRMDVNKGGKWISPFPLRSNHWWKKEIEEIGKEFAEESDRLDYQLVKKLFKNRNGWEVEKPVEGISIMDKSGRWRYDAYKNKIAVEVELSSRSQVFKDALKFLIGQAMSQIEVGVMMVRNRLEERGKPYLGSVERDSHAIYTSLPMLKMVFYGFPNRSGEKSS